MRFRSRSVVTWRKKPRQFQRTAPAVAAVEARGIFSRYFVTKPRKRKPPGEVDLVT